MGDSYFEVSIVCDRRGCGEESDHQVWARDLQHAHRKARVEVLRHGWARLAPPGMSPLDICPRHPIRLVRPTQQRELTNA